MQTFTNEEKNRKEWLLESWFEKAVYVLGIISILYVLFGLTDPNILN